MSDACIPANALPGALSVHGMAPGSAACEGACTLQNSNTIQLCTTCALESTQLVTADQFWQLLKEWSQLLGRYQCRGS